MELRVWEKPLYRKGSVLDTVTEMRRRRWRAHCRTCLPRSQEKLHWTLRYHREGQGSRASFQSELRSLSYRVP